MVGTLPGRTQGLGLITEPLIADLGIDRVTYAGLNFWATILGSAAALAMGHAIDRFGTRNVLTLTAVSLGLVVCAMSRTRTCCRARDLADADARARPERAVGREPRDGRPLVREADRRRHGDLQHRHEHRLHDRVSDSRRGRAELGLARRVAGDRMRAHRRARTARVGWSCAAVPSRSACAGRGRSRRSVASSGHAATCGAMTGYPWRSAIAHAGVLGVRQSAPRSTASSRPASASSTNRSSRSAASVRTCTTRRWSSRR